MNTERPTAGRLWLFVVARVYLGVSFFFSDHGNRRPGEFIGFIKYATEHATLGIEAS
jgi:hypothetical protein